MANLWKSGTTKAFHGYVANLAIGIVGGLILWAMEPSALELLSGEVGGYLTASIIFALAGVAALVYYVMGLNEMKKAAGETALATATNRLYIGALLTIIGSVLLAFLATAIFGAIIYIVGFIITWTGYSLIKNNANDANAKLGGEKLATSALLIVIAGVVGLLPVVGDVLKIILNVGSLWYAYEGWKAISNSELE